MNFVCVVCRRELPIEQGRPIDAEQRYPSYMCADTADCMAAFRASGKWCDGGQE